MRKLDELLDLYSLSHKNILNKRIHYFCVPAILFSTIGLLMSAGFVLAMASIILSSIYYYKLSKKYFLLMLIFQSLAFVLNLYISKVLNLFYFSAALFIVSWLTQFIGHKIEGKKPSFLDDLHFLLIGPLWVLKSLLNLWRAAP